jgi:HlyD family secretion protein
MKLRQRLQLMMAYFKKNTKRNVFFLLIIILALIFALRGCRGTEVDYYLVAEQGAKETVLANGLVVGDGVVDLTMPVAGQVAQLKVQAGDDVRQGDILLELDPTRQELSVQQQKAAYDAAVASRMVVAEGDVATAAARYAQAQAEATYLEEYFKRQTLLFEAGGLSEMNFLAARRDAQVAVAKMQAAGSDYQSANNGRLKLAYAQEAQAKAQFELGVQLLRDMALRAPFDGKILKVLVNTGETVATGTPVVKMLQGDRGLHIELKIDESEVGKVRVGQEAFFSVAAQPDKLFKSSVREIGALVDNQSGTYAVALFYAQADRELLADMTVSAQIVVAEYQDVIVVPTAWTINEDSQVYVLVYSGGRARRSLIEGRLLGDGYFLVEKGLEPGEKIVLPTGVADGDKVRLKKQVNDV